MSDTNESIGRDHNKPPELIVETPDEILARLGAAHSTLAIRRDTLAGIAARIPAEDKMNDEWEQKFLNAMKTTKAFVKAVDARRQDEKDPFLQAEQAVDGFFAQISGPIERLRERMGEMLTNYQNARARAETRKREAELAAARKRQEDAERKAAETAAAARKKRLADDARELAQRVAERAIERVAVAIERTTAARKAVAVKPAELSRVRTDLGAVGSLRTHYTFEIIDPAKVPRSYCTPSKELIDAAIKAHTTRDGKCSLKVPGLRIFAESNTVVR